MQSVLAPLVGPKVCVPPSLSGRVAIVTGGALGIGYEVSRAFAKAGAKVIMVNRKEEQGDEAIAKIKKETPEAKIEWVGCDLGTLSEVKEVFSGLAKKEERLDLVSALFLFRLGRAACVAIRLCVVLPSVNFEDRMY